MGQGNIHSLLKEKNTPFCLTLFWKTKIERFSNFQPYFKDYSSSMGESDDADEIGNKEKTEERHRRGKENLLISAVTISVNVFKWNQLLFNQCYIIIILRIGNTTHDYCLIDFDSWWKRMKLSISSRSRCI